MPTLLTDTLRHLKELQVKVSEGDAATVDRNEAAFQLWLDGMTQREIAEHLDRVDRDCGGDGVTHAMVAKMIARMRAAREADMLTAAIS